LSTSGPHLKGVFMASLTGSPADNPWPISRPGAQVTLTASPSIQAFQAGSSRWT
jgi:hypothetical protein